MSRVLTKAEWLDFLYQAIETFNEMQEADEQLPALPETALYCNPENGEAGLLDSMGLMNFLVTVDEMLDEEQDTVGLAFNINTLLEQKETALKNISALAAYLSALQKA